MNGDQVSDIIVGASGFDGADGDRADAGAVFVFFGSSSLAGRLDIDAADVTLQGADPGDGLGSRIDTGDLDSDGVDDIVVSAGRSDGPNNGRSNSGGAYAIFGGDSIAGPLDLATREAGAVIYGPHASSLAGTSLAVSDLDGDGRDDVVLGAALASSGGRSLNGMIFVAVAEVVSGQVDLNDAGGLFLYGDLDADSLGSGLAVGDINSDGCQELILGVPGSEAGDGLGAVVVVALP